LQLQAIRSAIFLYTNYADLGGAISYGRRFCRKIEERGGKARQSKDVTI
jgi:hypothetical protein